MLSTEELRTYILDQINGKISEDFSDYLFFSDVGKNRYEGAYVFSEENLYYIKYVEKWQVRKEITTDNEREVLWHILHEITAHTIIVYASQNREFGKDFRRPLFEKEIEIFSLFGKDFETRKKREIEEILVKHPYIE